MAHMGVAAGVKGHRGHKKEGQKKVCKKYNQVAADQCFESGFRGDHCDSSFNSTLNIF
jgi:hypothetical protein